MSDTKIPVPEHLVHRQVQEDVLLRERTRKRLFIGIPLEERFQENRVPLVPAAVRTLTQRGHRVRIQSRAGNGSRFSDHEYAEAGAEIVPTRELVFEASTLLKVAPLSLEEIDLCHAGQVVVSPIHLPTLTAEHVYRLKHQRVIALAIEYIKDNAGTFPFVRVMSEMAGLSAVHTAAELLATTSGGRGVLLGGVSGVPPAKVVVLGAGVVAEYAARAAIGMGAEVRVFDNNLYKLMRLQHNLGRPLYTSTLNHEALLQELSSCDVAIGAIHAEAGRTPVVVSEEIVERMRPGAVIVDVSIDQGGCFATSRVTTHEVPTFRMYDVIHYCVPNMASRTARTGSVAYSNILSSLLLEADGANIDELVHRLPGLRHGIYTYKGSLTNHYLGQRFGIKATQLDLLLLSRR